VHWAARRTNSDAVTESGGIKLFGRRFQLSPLTVAGGRFIGLRWPITIFLGAKRQRTKLLLGIAIFSVLWDAAYILFGMLGGKSGIDQMQMVFLPIGTIVAISCLVFGFKKLRAFLVSRRMSRPAAAPALICCPPPNPEPRYALALRTADTVFSPEKS
jgi:hypothetical protein